MIKIENGYGKVNMDAFIIPNHAALAKDYILGANKFQQQHERLAFLNMYDYDPDNDKLVQLWFVQTGEIDNCDNMHDHTFFMENEDHQVFHSRIDIAHLPMSLLEGKHEGDIIEVDIPIRATRVGEPEEEYPFTLKCTIRLNQTGYRYARFGTFEKTLAYVAA